MDITLKPLLDDQGYACLIIYEAFDITERIRLETALVQKQEKIQRLYQVEMCEPSASNPCAARCGALCLARNQH